MNALEVLGEVIRRNGLHDAVLTLISHAPRTGWRERADMPLLPQGVPVQGRVLSALSLDQLRGYRRAEGDCISVASRLGVQNGHRHLAMMDLQVNDQAPFPLSFLADIVDEHCGGKRSWILRSGRGCHVYGGFLLDEDDWRRWNGRYLTRYTLANPLYVMRSLSWRSNLLRLTPGSDHEAPPTTVEDQAASPIMKGARRLAHARHGFQVGGGGEPVVGHLAEVAAIAMRIHTGCRSLPDVARSASTPDELYACGYLHACLEDTATRYEDVSGVAGPRIAEWVAELSRDKRVPSADASSYEDQLARASLPARIVKLADLLAQLRGLDIGGREGWTPDRVRSIERQLGRIGAGLEACREFEQALELVAKCRDRLDQTGA